MAVDDWFRVSSIGKLCPREEVLCFRRNAWREDVVSSDLGMVFAVGHGIHWMMQNIVLAGRGLIGQWRCTWCGETYGSFDEGLVRRPESCLRCGAIAGEAPRMAGRPDKSINSDAFLYVEQWIGDFNYKIGGHPDGFWVEVEGEFTKEDVVLVEFKTASKNNFFGYKKSPDFMHVIQCQVYMWLTGYRRAKVIYLEKGTFGMGGVAIHDLEYDPEIVERVKEACDSVRAGLVGGAIPERQMCADRDCQRAKGCVVVDRCFDEKASVA